MKVGIVGGSIAGCSAAFQFIKAGHEVSVFERSNKALVGRGGGIGTTPALIEELKSIGLINDDFASFKITKMPFIGKLADEEPYGKLAWSMPMIFQVFQWNELWHQLRDNIPDECYHKGTRIVGANSNADGTVTLSSEDSSSWNYDLVLFADGYHSLGRSILFPNKQLKYRGYVLWRGLLPESEIDNNPILENAILRLSYSGKPGHNVVYYIPNTNGSIKEGERIYNWAAYISVPENELNELMTDANGKVWEGTLPPGKMQKKNERRLTQFLADNTPSHYADIVNKTKDSYVQVIYTLNLDAYYKDKMCLIGDAGMVVQPFTGTGVFKGYNNVKDLIECMHAYPSLEDALRNWSGKQIESGRKLLTLGEQMEKAFIWNQLDFAHASEAEVQQWWKDSVHFPENFSYEMEETGNNK